MKRVISNFKKYRFLLVELVKKDIKLKYRRSYLGILWTMLEPLLTMVVLTFVFRKIFTRGDATFPVYILSGRLLYGFFANSTKAAMKAIRSNSAMIKKVYVPKYIYPFASVLSNYLIFLISLIMLVIVAIFFRVWPTLYIFQAIIPLVIILILSLGVGMILSTMAVFFRDLEYLWGVAVMLIMYTSAIFYDIHDLKLSEMELMVFRLNPLYVIIVNFRAAVFGVPMDGAALLLSVIYSIVALILGVFLFYKKQDEFILNI